jgi:GTPase SAR1 family protein
VKIKFGNFIDWFLTLFGFKKSINLGIYGAPNVGKTTLANRIALDWTGEKVGKVSEIPHETRWVQKKERIEIKAKNKNFNKLAGYARYSNKNRLQTVFEIWIIKSCS